MPENKFMEANKQVGWELEFPGLFRWKNNPKLLIWNTFVGFERLIRKIIIVWVWLFITYLVYLQIDNFVSHQANWSTSPLRDWALKLGSGYRSAFYVVWTFWSVLLLIEGAIELFINKNAPRVAKLVWKWILVFLLITFSYAIAGFIGDLFYIMMGVHSTIIRGQNLSPSFDLFKGGSPQNIDTP